MISNYLCLMRSFPTVQWGSSNATQGQNGKEVFPISFSVECFTVVLTTRWKSSNANWSPTGGVNTDMNGVKYCDKTGFYGGPAAIATGIASVQSFYVAIGR